MAIRCNIKSNLPIETFNNHIKSLWYLLWAIDSPRASQVFVGSSRRSHIHSSETLEINFSLSSCCDHTIFLSPLIYILYLEVKATRGNCYVTPFFIIEVVSKQSACCPALYQCVCNRGMAFVCWSTCIKRRWHRIYVKLISCGFIIVLSLA